MVKHGPPGGQAPLAQTPQTKLIHTSQASNLSTMAFVITPKEMQALLAARAAAPKPARKPAAAAAAAAAPKRGRFVADKCSFCTKCVAVREEGHIHLPSAWLGFVLGLDDVQTKELAAHLARCCLTPNCEHRITSLRGRDMSAKTAKIWNNFHRSGVLTPAKAKVVRDALGWCCFNKPDDCECDESDSSSDEDVAPRKSSSKRSSR